MIALLPLVLLTVVVVNLFTWRRPTGLPSPAMGVRVLVPARNEAGRIRPTLRAARAQGPVTVLDDQSTDGTARVAEAEGATVLPGRALPSGWAGKNWAMEQLGQSCDEDMLVFIDADVVLKPGALAAIRAELEEVDVFTAVPEQATGSFAERVVLPLLHVAYAAWLPQVLVEWTSDPRFLSANGQVMAFRRSAWEQLGGMAVVRADLVDDMAITREAKKKGLTVRFADGHDLATTRMYDGLVAIWEGFSKNIYEGLGSPWVLAGVVGLHLLAFVVPYALLVAGLLGAPVDLVAAAVAVGANLVLRVSLAIRHGHPWVSVVLHPFAVLFLVAMALNSWRWSTRTGIRWAGRVYGTERA